MTVTTDKAGQRRIPEDTLALRLYIVRRELGLSQREAAARTGISFGSWQSMEDGREARGLDVKIAKISDALGYDRDWLMWGQQPAGYTPSRRAAPAAA